jgi:UPF0755 protein
VLIQRPDPLSYLRDPLTFALGLMAVFAVVVGYLFVEELRATPAAIAEDVAALERAPSRGAGELVAVEIPDGTGAAEIRQILLDAGVLEDAGAFDTLLAFSGFTAELKAGEYEFLTGMPASAVILQLRSGGLDADLVRIPEGLRVEEVGAILVAEGIVTSGGWEAALANVGQHPALLGKPLDASLLGYLLPASFPFRETTTADDAVRAMLDAFAEQVIPELRAEAAAAGLTMHEVLSLASIVEREAALPEEQPLVASVFLNRLEQWIALQADPTVQFVISTSESVEEFGWWKLGLEQADLDTDSLYNTYLYLGIPPGPIANPGIAAIDAVINPADTEFIFFVAAPECDGSHQFAATLGGHNANVEAFRASGCGE